MIRLLTRYADGREEKRTFDGERVRIGRDADNDLVLDTDLVSRHHCELKFRDQKLFVCDLESTNGTFVRAEQIEGEVELGSAPLTVGNVTIFAVES